jgi:hypothetical protein
MIEGICRVAGEIIQKEHNWRSTALRNASRRTSNIKEIYTPEYVAMMLAAGQSWRKHFEKDSIG